MRMATLFAMLMLLVGCDAPTTSPKQTLNGSPVRDVQFVIPGGETIKLPMTSRGAVPASNELIKIDDAGILVGPSKDNSKVPVIIFTFGFTVKGSETIEEVIVDELTESEVVPCVKDISPVINKYHWSKSKEQFPISQVTTPWLFSINDTIFLFRFFIKAKDREPMVLYQPSLISGQAKPVLLSIANRARVAP